MLAKVVCHAPTREAAARKLADTLARARIHGVVTNRDLLVRVLRSEAFVAGEVSAPLSCRRSRTGLRASSNRRGHAVAAAIALAEQAGAARTVQQGIPVGWRNVPSQPHRTEFEDGTSSSGGGGRDGYVLDGVTRWSPSSPTSSVTLETDGVRDDVRRHDLWRRRRRGRPDGPRPPDAQAAVHRPGRRGGERQPAGADARHGGQGRRRAGRRGGGRPGRAGARGDEDAAHRGGAVRRRGHPGRRPARDNRWQRATCSLS